MTISQNTKDEQIIRSEASDFARGNLKLGNHQEAIDQFHRIKIRLNDFYSEEAKAIFLDQIELILKQNLEKHRKQSHGGTPDDNCRQEILAERLLFYISQEISTLPRFAHQRNKTINTPQRNKVFISYSHLDEDFLKDIRRHFKPFSATIDFWDDSKISPGQKWREEIRKAIEVTKVAILLVSTDFLGSEYITTNELPPLLEAAENNGAIILTLIIKPCLFEAFPQLNQFQAMNPPNKPVIKLDDNEREDLYVNLVRQTIRSLSEQ